MHTLRENFDYYLAHQGKLVQRYNGRFIVVKDLAVVGDYPDQITAVEESVKAGLDLGSFLVQKVEPGTDAYTQTFHSRVAFA